MPAWYDLETCAQSEKTPSVRKSERIPARLVLWLYARSEFDDALIMKTELKTIEATIDPNGEVHLVQPLKLDKPAKALLTILPDDPEETALLSEPSLAEDWNRPEEDEAWSHRQPGR